MSWLWTVPVSTANRGAQASLSRDVREGRFNSIDYAEQVARAADVAGFDGVLVPSRADGDDPWIVAGAIARAVTRLEILVEYPTTFSTPVYAAKMAASFQAFTHGRLGIKVVSGHDLRSTPVLPGEDPAVRLAEHLEIGQGLWESTDFNFEGRVFEVSHSGLIPKLTRYQRPTVYLSGNDTAAVDLSARWADVHLFDTADPAELRVSTEGLWAGAALHGRTVRAGVRLSVLARRSTQEARSAYADSQGAIARLAGSYGEVADGLNRLAESGAEVVVLEASPSLEEAYAFAEFVRPNLSVATSNAALAS